MKTAAEYTIRLPELHARQCQFIDSTAKRKVVRAGRRGGKTVGAAVLAVEAFIRGVRVLYATPTSDQIDRFWHECTMALAEPIDAGVLYKNETKHIIELPGTEQRIRAKTAWNADTLRGDYCGLLILDEWQLMNEDAWSLVGAPMMLDTNGDAVFIYTPPSIRTAGVSKAHDKMHAAKMFKMAAADLTGRWGTFHFSSHENPYLNTDALADITRDMSSLAYRQEIGAEDIDEIPGALWTRAVLETNRRAVAPSLARIVVAIDPAASNTEGSNQTGIVVAGIDENDHGWVLADLTRRGSPASWGEAAVRAFDHYRADRILAESNNGGDMVEHVIRTAAMALFLDGERATPEIAFKQVHASRGKHTRAEPIAALYEHRRIHHVGTFPELEDELCSWLPGDDSPDRLDALVWAGTELLLGRARPNEQVSVSLKTY